MQTVTKKLIFNIILIIPTFLYGQYTGVVLSAADSTPITKAKIYLNNTESVFLTDVNGVFLIPSHLPNTKLTIKHPRYKILNYTIENESNRTFYLQPKEKEVNTIVITAGRKDQKIEEIPVSMEIIKPELVANKGMSNLAEAVDQSPGVYVMDGQVSIRGGGGYAYGAGSRVLLLWNGIPMLSPDVGDAKWNAVPMEQASQIEILKGASSVLYGSGALNGIIGLNEREPEKTGKIEAKIQSGIFDNPRRSSLKWWDRNPTFHMADIYYGKASGPFGFTIGANAFYNEAYRMGEMEKRGRLNGSFYYRPLKENANFKAGISYNLQFQDVGVFVLWKNDSMCYQAMDNTISRQKAVRFNIDPYIKFIDKNDNKHYLRTRYYLVTTGNEVALYDASFAQMYYGDYQFQKKLKSNGSFTCGATNTLNKIKSWVFGDHISENAAAYSQFEFKRKSFDFTTGIRLEYCKLDSLEEDSEFTIGSFSSPVYPIVRAGIHWEPNKGTHLRASLGQGVRFPSVAERYVSTSVGGVVIFKNPELKAESGYAAEIGMKQVIKIGAWKALADVSGFANYYSNMTEFTFGLYKPDTLGPLQTANPDTITYFYKWVGFQAQNAEQAFIGGAEFSFSSMGKIGEVDLTTLLGYTYMYPISLNKDSVYQLSFSDPSSNMLKYRFNHMAKADIQATYKSFSMGVSTRYNSFMRNIDAVFEDGVLGQELLVGMSNYRAKFNHGTAVIDARFGYQINDAVKVNFIANNVFNTEYVSRPGTVQAPRNFLLQMQLSL